MHTGPPGGGEVPCPSPLAPTRPGHGESPEGLQAREASPVCAGTMKHPDPGAARVTALTAGPRRPPPRPEGREAHLGRRPVQLRPRERVGGGSLGQGLQVGQVALQGLGQRAALQAEAPLVRDALLRAPAKEREVSGGLRAQRWLHPRSSRQAQGRQGRVGTQAPGQATRA